MNTSGYKSVAHYHLDASDQSIAREHQEELQDDAEFTLTEAKHETGGVQSIVYSMAEFLHSRMHVHIFHISHNY